MRLPRLEYGSIGYTLVLFLLNPFFVAAKANSLHNQFNFTSPNTWFIGIGSGPNWISLNSSTRVLNGSGALPPMNEDVFSINHPSGSHMQLLIGHRWFLAQTIFPFFHLYLQYQHYNNTHIEGRVTQYSLAEFKNYDYQISYEANSFLLTSKIDLIKLNNVLPFITGGIGSIFNHINDYKESATAFVTPRTSPAYNGKTILNAAITVGAGFDVILTQNYWLTFGYEHLFQSNISSGAGANSWSGTQLSFGKASIDNIFINFSANFPQGFRS